MDFQLVVDHMMLETANIDWDNQRRRRMPDHLAPGRGNWAAIAFYTAVPVVAAPLSWLVLDTLRVGRSWHSVTEYMDSLVGPQDPGRMEQRMRLGEQCFPCRRRIYGGTWIRHRRVWRKMGCNEDSFLELDGQNMDYRRA